MCALQKIVPHGRFVGRPQSSPLMKLARRPKHWPIGSQAATRSATPSSATLLAIAKPAIATPTPIIAPWKLMPPFQTSNTSSGWANNSVRWSGFTSM